MAEKVLNNECITIDEMLDFVSIGNINGEAMKLITKVNAHICKCENCFKQIEALQTLDKGFKELSLTPEKKIELKAELKAEHPGF